MGSAASTPGQTNAATTVALEDPADLSLDELCQWVRAQGAGQVGDDVATRCRDSGLSAAELLLHMDQETLLEALQISVDDQERKQLFTLIQCGRKALRREFRVSLKELPDAIDRAIYVFERFPIVLDPSGQATRFLRYQRSAVLMAGNPKDMAPESLRRHLVAALKHGTWLIIDFDMLNTLELEQFFTQDSFPREIFSRHALFKPELFTKLLRSEDGDPAAFMVSDQFKFIVLCRSEQPPPKTALAMHVLHVPDSPAASAAEGKDASSAPHGENDQLARALGVSKDVKRNSLEMVEAAFENDLEIVTKWLDQNYDIESADGHGHSALSEAACQGHNEMVAFLLGHGADPNKLNDQRRSALYRAAYNGHVATVQLLLESGADPRIVSKQSETAFDVAKTSEVQEQIQQWDVTKTDGLLEKRRQVIEQQWQERISNHVEREQFARMKIHEELFELVRTAAAADSETKLEDRFEQLIDEAMDTGEKPRASADIRDDKGATLLAVACQLDHVAIATLLLTKWKVWRELAHQSRSQATGPTRKELVKKQEMMAKMLKANVNARDCRGWTPVAIAVFHESKKCLRVLLENGADPKLKNQYNKNAFDFAKDDIDAALNVVKSRDEIRQVLLDWENERRAVAVGGGDTDSNAGSSVVQKVENAPKAKGAAAADGKKKAKKKPPSGAAGASSSTSISKPSAAKAKQPVIKK